jgi:hypothetical protein
VIPSIQTQGHHALLSIGQTRTATCRKNLNQMLMSLFVPDKPLKRAMEPTFVILLSTATVMTSCSEFYNDIVKHKVI